MLRVRFDKLICLKYFFNFSTSAAYIPLWPLTVSIVTINRGITQTFMVFGYRGFGFYQYQIGKQMRRNISPGPEPCHLEA